MRVRVALTSLALLLLGAAAPAAPSAAKVRKLTYMVPVSQPDEFGAAVALDTDVYLPRRRPPRRGFPLVVVFHGGDSTKANGFDAGHARALARRGYASLIYTQRGNSGSGGQTTVAGPKEIRDLFDVLAWLTRGRGAAPGHPDFRVDRGRIGLLGDSLGGLHANLAQAYAGIRRLNPYRFRFRAIAPGNTPDRVFDALVEHGVAKLSYGAGLLATFAPDSVRLAPIGYKWIATVAADQPQLQGYDVCDARGHDTATSTTKQDLAARSVGCMLGRVTTPVIWGQALDDGLFPGEMAVRAWRRLPRRADDRLIMRIGGHAAPVPPQAAHDRVFAAQVAFLDHHLRGRPLRLPRVLYWARDPRIAVPNDSYAYPPRAWIPRRARSWPPPGTRQVAFSLGAAGRAVRRGARRGQLPLAPLSFDQPSDPVTRTALSATPVGSSPLPARLARLDLPGFVAGFRTHAFHRTRELSGSPRALVQWIPGGPDTQLVVKVFDLAPGGRLTLLSRGVRGVRGSVAGRRIDVRIEANATSALVRRGHRLLVWVSAGDLPFYKPYAAQSGGVLEAGPRARVWLPLR